MGVQDARSCPLTHKHTQPITSLCFRPIDWVFPPESISNFTFPAASTGPADQEQSSAPDNSVLIRAFSHWLGRQTNPVPFTNGCVLPLYVLQSPCESKDQEEELSQRYSRYAPLTIQPSSAFSTHSLFNLILASTLITRMAQKGRCISLL